MDFNDVAQTLGIESIQKLKTRWPSNTGASLGVKIDTIDARLDVIRTIAHNAAKDKRTLNGVPPLGDTFFDSSVTAIKTAQDAIEVVSSEIGTIAYNIYSNKSVPKPFKTEVLSLIQKDKEMLSQLKEMLQITNS